MLGKGEFDMPIRIGGMVTGMDTDLLVKQMMQAKRIPVDRLEAKKTIKQWTRDQYREMNKMFDTLRREAMAIGSVGTIGAKKATVSNETIATAQASSNAIPGTYTLKVNQTASSASAMSGQLGITGTEKLTATDLVLNVTGEKGTKAITIKADTSTIDGVVSAINAQSTSTGVRAMYDKATDRMYFASVNSGEPSFVSVTGADATANTFLSSTLKFASPTTTNLETGSRAFANTTTAIDSTLAAPVDFTLNGKTLTIDKNTTISQLQDQLNQAGLSSTVSLSLNAAGNVQLQSTGAITLAEGSGGLAALGLNSRTSSTTSSIYAKGTNAEVEFNGVPGVVEFRSNTFVLNNISFTAKKADPATTLSVTVNDDPDAVVASVKKFVEKYNEIIEKINGEVQEKYDRGFQPLTKEQKESMSEDEIKKWEEKAQSGLLRNDSILKNALSQMRGSLASPVTDLASPNLLAGIGITTDRDYTTNGKLTFDEFKFKQALASDPDGVKALFTREMMADADVPATNPDGTAKTDAQKLQYKLERSGVGTRLVETLNQVIGQISKKAGGLFAQNDNNQIGKEITGINDQISKKNAQLARFEQQYYSQFARLESAINKMNQQSSWLSQQMGTGGGY